MDFWERLDALVAAKTSRKALLSELGLASNAITLWRKRSTYPAADVAVDLANKLGTTVEELVKGVPAKRVPPRLSLVFEDLLILNEVQIDPIFRLAHSYAAEILAENDARPAAPDPGTKANRTAAQGSINPVPGRIMKEGDA
jgi:transcriptional regulator with XRE-family HTH domain